MYQVYYLCVDRFRKAKQKLDFEKVDATLVQPYLGDFKPALLVKTDEGKKGKIKNGDLLYRINKTRITNVLDPINAINKASNIATAHVIRKGKKLRIKIPVVNDKKAQSFYDTLKILTCQVDMKYLKDDYQKQIKSRNKFQKKNSKSKNTLTEFPKSSISFCRS